MSLSLTHATADHLAGITDIYNHAVVHTTAIWNEQTVDVANRAAWLAQRRAAGYPVLVALDGDEVTGYASFGDFRAFDGYRYSIEHSVYVRSGRQGQGIGQALMSQLIDEARGLGKHLMIAAIESGNTASIRLHQRLGFEVSGCMREVGTKFGRWLDLTWMQLRLNEGPPRA
ncbi:GNAT family N-acetyltransferase [Caldimonas brevitalea]|uniref:Acetyltransferase n=1 Tax=Caldimonas brevitalea TaxID=413882 RepID=A0A0G3BRU5_9BURK|nr:GNAT family N-acetyltransferase [Caldimonas brevitalea]AKJ32137.1 acetyltransferase [Caldimonas brevitalea]